MTTVLTVKLSPQSEQPGQRIQTAEIAKARHSLDSRKLAGDEAHVMRLKTRWETDEA